jgi:hypothetical protein
MSFCTLTPGEIELLVYLLKESPKNVFQYSTDAIELIEEPIPFSPEFGISTLQQATSESYCARSLC